MPESKFADIRDTIANGLACELYDKLKDEYMEPDKSRYLMALDSTVTKEIASFQSAVMEAMVRLIDAE